MADWCKAQGDRELEIMESSTGIQGVSRSSTALGVDRMLGWLSRSRRLSKDYERKVQISEMLTQKAMIRLLIARLCWSTYSILSTLIRGGGVSTTSHAFITTESPMLA